MGYTLVLGLDTYTHAVARSIHQCICKRKNFAQICCTAFLHLILVGDICEFINEYTNSITNTKQAVNVQPMNNK